MSEQKVVICKDLKSELQDFLSSLKYDKLFILMDTNTKEKCFPLVEDIPAFQKAPILVMEAGDMNKGFVSLAQIWTALSNEGASRNSLLVNLGGGMITDMGGRRYFQAGHPYDQYPYDLDGVRRCCGWR